MIPPAMRLAPRAALLIAVAASPLAAQARVTLTPFASSNRSLPDAPNVYGLGITSWAGIMGIRASGALGELRTEKYADGTSRTRPGAWTADADLVLAPAQSRLWRAAFPGFEPAGFVGIGTEGDRTESGERRSAPTWSWGGSLAVPVAGPLAIESEARWRRPFEHYDRPVPPGYGENWEFRVGLAFRFGSSSGRGRGRDDWPSSGSRVPIPGRPSGSRTSGSSGGRIALPAPSVPATRVLNTADDYLGTPYVYGGTSPDGFDCSGFVQYVYRRHGVTLPRTSRQQAIAGSVVSASVAALQPGDLMFFASRGSRIDHVAIYAGERRIIHSTSSGGGVRFDDLRSTRGRWFVEHMVAARRVNDGGVRFDASDLVKALSELDAGDLAPRP